MKSVVKVVDYIQSLLDISRWKNGLFIVTLLLFSYIFLLQFAPNKAALVYPYLGLLICSTWMISSAGYIINDYFDINIDKINRPQRYNTVIKLSKRHLIIWHILLSSIGLLIALYCAFELGKMRLAFYQIFCIAALFMYSFTFKKIALLGNLIISLLSVLAIWLLPSFAFGGVYIPLLFDQLPPLLLQLLFTVSVFSFGMTLLREITKDCEDIKGDLQNGCKTLPIIWGIKNCKRLLLILNLIILVYYIYTFFELLSINTFSILCFVSFIAFNLYTIYLIFYAFKGSDFRQVSSWIKLLMILGLSSTLFFVYY